jgi:hypothetical protein
MLPDTTGFMGDMEPDTGPAFPHSAGSGFDMPAPDTQSTWEIRCDVKARAAR